MVPICLGVKDVERVLYKQLFAGDFKKFTGKSNVKPAVGGGARDIRYGHFSTIKPIVQRMFPTLVPTLRKRGGKKIKVNLQEGRVRWKGSKVSFPAYFEPAQDKRPGEWRFARVKDLPILATAAPKGSSSNPDMVVLLQDKSQDVWIVHTTRSVVVADTHLKKRVNDAFSFHKNPKHAVFGYIEFTPTYWSY